MEINGINKNDDAYVFAALLSCGVPKVVAYKFAKPASNAKGASIPALSTAFKSTIEVQKAIQYINEQLKAQYTKTEYKTIDLAKLRDKEKLLLEINESINNTTDQNLLIKHRQQLIDLEQMRKQDSTENSIIRPLIYLPYREGSNITPNITPNIKDPLLD